MESHSQTVTLRISTNRKMTEEELDSLRAGLAGAVPSLVEAAADGPGELLLGVNTVQGPLDYLGYQIVEADTATPRPF